MSYRSFGISARSKDRCDHCERTSATLTFKFRNSQPGGEVLAPIKSRREAMLLPLCLDLPFNLYIGRGRRRNPK
jgi:hypothetical protein